MGLGEKAGPYVGDEAASIKDAEHQAARAALKACGQNCPKMPAKTATPVAQKKGIKKPQPKGTVQNDPISKVNHAVAVLNGRMVSQDDITYTFHESGKPPQAKFKSTLAIQGLGTYTGQMQDSKKEAKKSAAAKALNALKSKIGPAMEAHKVLKAQKEEEWEQRKAMFEESGQLAAPAKKKTGNAAAAPPT